MTAAAPSTLSILLVEDSPADGRLLMEALRPAVTAGEVVLQTVKRLALAVEAMATIEFNCVLLDLGLPDGRGINNVRALREVDRKTAIIVLTGLADEKLAAEALTLGAQDYLIKGECDGEQLLKQLRHAVQRNRQTFALEARRDLTFFEASHDALSLLPNAALFADRARQQLAAAIAAGQVFRLAWLQVQGVVAARQRYGAPLADELLKRLSERLSEGLGAGETLAYLGDAAFAVLRLGSCNALDWSRQLEHCQQRVASLSQLGDCTLQLQLLTGLIEAADGNKSVEDLLELAQAAASPASPPIAQPLIELHPSTGAASPPMRWQAWVDIGSLRCAGFECSPLPTEDAEGDCADGATAAAQVLAYATTLAEQARAWLGADLPPLVLSLDVPARALMEAGFDQQLADVLLTSGWPVRDIQLEIGEAAFRQLSLHSAALMRLRGRGFRLFMDGDGTQDISLHDFAAFTLDGYKLSPAVTRALLDENLQGRSRRVISAVLGAAQQLGAVVIATGVDSEASAVALRLIGVRWMQGRALLPALEAAAVPVASTQTVLLRN